MRILNPLRNASRALNAEHWNLFDRLFSVITPDFALKYKLMPLYEPFADTFARERETYSMVRKFAKTAEIAEADKTRDRGLRQVDLGIEMGLLDTDPDVVEAARRCGIVIAAYPKAAKKSYDVNTSAVRAIVERFLSDEYAADIAKLGLTEKVATLKTLNEAFEALYMARVPEEYRRAKGDKMLAIRPLMEKAYEDLADGINAAYIVATIIEPNPEGAAEIEALAKLVNAVIHKFSRTLADRGIGHKAKGEDEGAPSQA